MAGKVKIPDPGKSFREGAVKYAVDKSCKAAAGALLKSQGTSISETDQKVVVDQLCLVVGLTADALLKGENMSATDVGIFLTKEKVNLVRLSQKQQMLCAAAVVDLALNGYKIPWARGAHRRAVKMSGDG